MKKIFTLTLLAGYMLSATGRQLSPEEALGRLSSTGHGVKAKKIAVANPVYTEKASGEATAYVFNTGEDGFIIVSADDAGAPLLGFSDKGSFNPDNIPAPMQEWLGFYSDQIATNARHNLQYSPRKVVERTEIAPLCKSLWGQDSPYNDNCPVFNGKHGPTGCVATAVAQVMYYHKWPPRGTGSNTYSSNGRVYSANFANSVYDWDAMTDTYDANSSAASKAAVAQLMFDVGVAVDMDYLPTDAGAMAINITRLGEFFYYSPDNYYANRAYYTTPEWEDLVYSQLSENMPVLYGGSSNHGGHRFVCDGYREGYYHINWGWNGLSDGYFLLDALNPEEQGTGGTFDNAGYNYDQSISVNIRPATEGEVGQPHLFVRYNFGNTEGSSSTLGSVYTFAGQYENLGCTNFSGYFGAKAVNTATGEITYMPTSVTFSTSSLMYKTDMSVIIPTTLQEGTYIVTPVCKMKNSDEWLDIKCPLTAIGAQLMTVEGTKVTFRPYSTNTVEISNVTFDTDVYFNQSFEMSFTATNIGTTGFYDTPFMVLFNSAGTQVAQSAGLSLINLEGGESQEITYIGQIKNNTLNAGSYYFGLYSFYTGRQLYFSTQPIEIKRAPTPTLRISDFSVNDGAAMVAPNGIKFSGLLSCSSGYFGNRLMIIVYKSGQTSTSNVYYTPVMILNSGDSEEFAATGSIGDFDGIAQTYYASVMDEDQTMVIGGPYSFFVSAAAGTDLTVAEEEEVVFYNLQGQKIANPVKGQLYIKKQGNKTSKILY